MVCGVLSPLLLRDKGAIIDDESKKEEREEKRETDKDTGMWNQTCQYVSFTFIR